MLFLVVVAVGADGRGRRRALLRPGRADHPSSVAAGRRPVGTDGADHADHFANSDQVVGARLGLLGDVFAVPHQVGIANVFSAGDVIICVGVIVLVHAAAGCPWALPVRRRPLPFSAGGVTRDLLRGTAADVRCRPARPAQLGASMQALLHPGWNR